MPRARKPFLDIYSFAARFTVWHEIWIYSFQEKDFPKLSWRDAR
jgi:hypothetical protein